jgi:hypothetical protein
MLEPELEPASDALYMLEPELELPPGTRAGNVVAELMEVCPPPIPPPGWGSGCTYSYLETHSHSLNSNTHTGIAFHCAHIPRPRLSEKPRVLRGAPDLSFLPYRYRPPALTLCAVPTTRPPLVRSCASCVAPGLFPPHNTMHCRDLSLTFSLTFSLRQTQRIERHVFVHSFFGFASPIAVVVGHRLRVAVEAHGVWFRTRQCLVIDGSDD